MPVRVNAGYAGGMEEILQKARELGRTIGAHSRTVEFMAAARAVAADRAAQQLLNDFQQQIDALRQRQAAGQPIEPQDKRRAADLQARVADDEKLKTMLRTQADYVQMMQAVHAAIEEAVGEVAET